MINGFHTIIYSDDAETTRAFFDEGLGLTTLITVPGAGQMMLYEARHDLAHQLRD